MLAINTKELRIFLEEAELEASTFEHIHSE